ncbi:hypothetical protein C3495_09360 [Clostridiaceae bacterium 14S0207]|nr:hypothetical protein C3495_09360 [Clostridiaceae bacterium 14S0207]
MLENYKCMNKENIYVFYMEKDKCFVEETLEKVIKAYEELSDYFEIKKGSFNIKVILACNRKEYENLVLNLLKVNIEIPSRKSRIAQPQEEYLVLLSPNVYEEDSIYKYDQKEYERLIYHETTHMFEEYLCKDMENSSLWFGEGLAVYLSQQWKYEKEFRKTVEENVKNCVIPNLRDIDKNRIFAYEWGWTLIKYIEEKYGKNTINKIVRNYENGDVFGYMKVNMELLEKQWKRWVLNEKNIK